MKNLLLVVGLALSYTANAQWVTKTVDNDFDEPYRIAYTKDNGMILMLNNIAGELSFILTCEYICEDELTVDMSFIVNGVAKKYTFNAITSDDREAVIFIENLMNEKCLLDFKECSSVKIRINDTICGSVIYQFNMNGSASALKFMINE